MHRPIIGITGGICSGKSEVARMLGDLGCCVCVSDDLARRVLDEPAVRAQIAAVVGSTVIAPDGSIRRDELARALFAHAETRARVEAIMHPRIAQLRRELFAVAPTDAPAFVIDAPLLCEVGLDRECDAVIFVDATHESRVERAKNTRGWTAEDLDRREAAQLPLASKRERSSDVIHNASEREREREGEREGDRELLRETLRERVALTLKHICARQRQPQQPNAGT